MSIVCCRRPIRLILILLLTLSLTPPASHAASVRLRFANFPGAGTFPCVSMERWAAELDKRLPGAAVVETFPGGTLLEAKNMVRGVMQGQADIGCISLAYHPGAYPFLSVFELPLGFSSAREASEVMYDIFMNHEVAETSKIKVIALFSSAPSQVLSSKPLKSPDDLKGFVVRSSGILADIAAALGASPVSMPQSDTPEALQKGLVQGVFTSFDVLKDYNFAESCRYGMVTDMPVYPMIFFMNLKKWKALSPELQQAIMDISREHSLWTGEYVDTHGKEATAWAEETYGFTLTHLSPEQQRELRARAETVVEEWVKKAEAKGIAARELLAEVMAARAALAR